MATRDEVWTDTLKRLHLPVALRPAAHGVETHVSRDRVSGRVLLLPRIYPLPYGQRLTVSNTHVSRDRVSGRVLLLARIYLLPHGQRLTVSNTNAISVRAIGR